MEKRNLIGKNLTSSLKTREEPFDYNPEELTYMQGSTDTAEESPVREPAGRGRRKGDREALHRFMVGMPMPDREYDKLKEISAMSGMSISKIVSESMLEFIRKWEDENGAIRPRRTVKEIRF